MVTTNLLVSQMLEFSEDRKPTSWSGPVFLMQGMVQPSIFVMFSKDVITLTGEVGIYLHLSVSHPNRTPCRHGWITREFTTILGDPVRTNDVHLSWIYEGQDQRHPGVLHHSFWAA